MKLLSDIYGTRYLLRIATRTIFFVLLFLCTVTCTNDKSDTIDVKLPATSVLDMQTNWAVITSSHLRLRGQPDTRSGVETTLWRGYVLEVLSKQNRQVEVEGSTDYWYQISYGGLQGWVFGAYLTLYDSLEIAESAAEKLRE